METITLNSAVAFLIGMIVVYLLFRCTGIFIIVAFCAISSQAHTVTVVADSSTNWQTFVGPVTSVNEWYPPGVSVEPVTFDANGQIYPDWLVYYGVTDADHDYVYEAADDTLITIPSQEPENSWPAIASGMGIGFLLCGFGWIFRLVRQVGRDF